VGIDNKKRAYYPQQPLPLNPPLLTKERGRYEKRGFAHLKLPVILFLRQ
jgi:hypothetical protein